MVPGRLHGTGLEVGMGLGVGGWGSTLRAVRESEMHAEPFEDFFFLIYVFIFLSRTPQCPQAQQS